MSNVFQTCLKDFKLKKLVVEPKMAQPIEPDEEPIDSQLNWLRGTKKHSLSSRTVVQPVKVRSMGDRGLTVTCQTLNAND